jgi:hypothetical protein
MCTGRVQPRLLLYHASHAPEELESTHTLFKGLHTHLRHRLLGCGTVGALPPNPFFTKKKQATIIPAPQPCNSATSPPAPARGGPSLTWLRRMGSLSCMGTCVDGGRGGVLCADVVGSLQVSVFFAATSKLPAGGCKQAARPVHRAGQPTPWVTLVETTQLLTASRAGRHPGPECQCGPQDEGKAAALPQAHPVPPC